jgi:hypothetical protein
MTGSPLLVSAAAAELPRVGLDDALGVCLVFAVADPDRYYFAAARWLGRYALERRPSLVQLRGWLDALDLLGDPDGRPLALRRLRELAVEQREPAVTAMLDLWAGRRERSSA